MIFDHLNYRDYLKEVLAERLRQNRQYSLRGFARNLGIQPSLLSEVLGGRRKLSSESANLVAQQLGLSDQERDYFELMVQLERAKNPTLRESTLRKIQQINPRKKDIHDLSVDYFQMISEWYHFAILRMTEIENFEWSVKSVARALGIHEVECSLALERLERLQLIQYEKKDGRPTKTKDNYLVRSPMPNDALRKYHQQMLQKTLEALSTQTPKERFTGTEDVLLADDQMKEATEIFEDCFTKILALSKRPSKKQKQVYHVGVHAIKLSQVNERKK
jgi:uncharacterized protein (TIGR02147 family)